MVTFSYVIMLIIAVFDCWINQCTDTPPPYHCEARQCPSNLGRFATGIASPNVVAEFISALLGRVQVPPLRRWVPGAGNEGTQHDPKGHTKKTEVPDKSGVNGFESGN